jgi:DNA replication ATP-dependent helicase Dna2
VTVAGSTYNPSCVPCGSDAHCDQPVIEGVIKKVERRVHAGSRGSVNGVRIMLETACGACRLDVGERFAYLCDGLSVAPEGLSLRAYHLRRARPSADVTGKRQNDMATFLSSPESLVVLEPDWLLNVTALVGTDYCLRQWLANRLASRPATLPQLRGTIVHGGFQALCREGSAPASVIESLVDDSSYGLALAGVSAKALIDDVQPHLERLSRWYAEVGADLFDGRHGVPSYESTLLCPELGLRGRTDLVFRRADGGERPLVTRIVELKTGKYKEQWPDPEFQVRGYYAILSSQQRLAPDFHAHVIYTGDASAAYREVECGPGNIDHIVTRRNQAVLAALAGFAPQSSSINRCRRSANRAECVRLSALLNLDNCQGRDLVDAASGGVDAHDATFYAAQYRLLRLESQATSDALATLWRLPPATREATGTAIVVTEELGRERCADGQWSYRFRCQNSAELRAGDTILLSDGDPIRGDVAIGTLSATRTDSIDVLSREPVVCPRLVDRYDSGEAQDRTLRALHAWIAGQKRTRYLVYGQQVPEFTIPERGPCPTSTSHRLNSSQVAALDLASRMRDFLLVQGPPGTGKTYLVACMVQMLAARGERIIVSAWTNQAVDTMLRALIELDFHQFARLGSARSMDPALLPYAVTAAPPGHSCALSPEAIAERLRTVPVLAGTVSAFADSRLLGATVQRDVAIVDEAAQLSVAASLGVLRLVSRFVLVGDDQQLPPVVQSEEAAREGLSLSPFALLRPDAQAHGAFARLHEQFRMHAAVAAWPNEAFYDNELTADGSVAGRRLPPATGPDFDPIVNRDVPIVVVDSGSPATAEIEAAVHAAVLLVRSGVPEEQVGVVAPFRATVAAIRRLLEQSPEAAGCTVDTVDRFQGGQREAMIVCLGLSGIERRTHAFVDDPRRLNVAFTRARAKLVVIGDLARARTLPTMAGFLHHCLDHGMPVVSADRAIAVGQSWD